MLTRSAGLIAILSLLLATAGPATGEELDLEKVRAIFEEGKKLNDQCVDTSLSASAPSRWTRWRFASSRASSSETVVPGACSSATGAGFPGAGRGRPAQ